MLPDLTATVNLHLESVKDVLIIPREAIARQKGQAVVEVMENGKSKLQPVKVGSMNECEAIIESGLKEGSIISLNPKITGEMQAGAER